MFNHNLSHYVMSFINLQYFGDSNYNSIDLHLIGRFLFKLYMGVMEFENYDDNELLMHLTKR